MWNWENQKSEDFFFEVNKEMNDEGVVVELHSFKKKVNVKKKY